VLIGLSAYYYYYYCRKIEKFAEAASVTTENTVDALSATLNGIISGEIISQTPYIEKLGAIPENAKLKIYLSSFSEKTNYDNRVNVYIPEASRWNNFIKANQAFTLVTNTQNIIPTVRYGGMSLNNISLLGIPSDELAIVNTQNRLPPFSATFFINFTTPAAAPFILPRNGFELFRIYLESPNYVRLTLKDSTADTNCKLLLEIGNGNILDTGDILKSALMSGDTVAITITYGISSGNKVIPNIYIGKMPATEYVGIGPGSDPVAPDTTGVSGRYTMTEYLTESPLILGNSQMTINKNKDLLNASLLAFMYHSNISMTFDDHKKLTEYLAKQNTDMPVIADVLTSASDKLQEIKDYITANTSAQLGLQQQLDKCKATVVKKPVVKAFGHLIKLDGISDSDVTSEDLRSCSILEVKNRLTNALAATNSAATTATGGPRFQINMPHGSASNVTPVPPS
jgi:hypothetical protein